VAQERFLQVKKIEQNIILLYKLAKSVTQSRRRRLLSL